MGALREVLAKFGFEVDTKKLDDAGKKTDGFASQLKQVAGIFAAGAVVGAIKGFIADVKEAAGDIKKTASLMGVSTEEAQRWTSAAYLAGVSAESLATGVKFLQKNLVAAAEGGGDAAAIFKKLGIEIKDQNGNLKPTGKLLGDVGLELAAMKDPAQRTAAVLKVFGKQGLELLPLFNKGEKGLQELLDRIDELGGGVSEEAIKALKEQGRATREYDLVMRSLKSQLVAQVVPALTQLVKFGTQVVAGFAQMTKGTNVFKVAAALAGALAVKWAIATYGAYLPIIAAVALLVLVLDDVVTLLQGGNSVAGDLIKKLFGKEAGESILKQIGRDANELDGRLNAINKKGGGILDKIIEVLSTVGGTIVKFIVDDIPEAWDFAMKDLGAGAPIAFNAILDSLVGVAKDFADWANSVADSVIDGIVNGVTSGASKVISAFASMGKAAFSAIRGVFESHSPSRKLFKFAREDLAIGGMAGGLLAGKKNVDQAMTAMYSVPPSAAGGGNATVTQHNRNEITIHASGGDASNLTSQVRAGVSQATGEDRRELLAALEPVGV